VVKLASTLRLEAVAEGISNRQQLLQLRRLRCPYGQGFFFSRPQPTAAIPGLLDLGVLEGVDPGE
jgi:EAL domain-containing protein (putative c-di-GMP-specific phosphodiesterase class I)